MRFIAVSLTQGREGVLEHYLRMGTCITKDMNEVLAMPLLADIAHSCSHTPGVEAELAGACRAQDVEQFIGFCSAHWSSLSLKFLFDRCFGKDRW